MAELDTAPTATATSPTTAEVDAEPNARPDEQTSSGIISYFKSRVEASKRVRRNKIPEWRSNIDIRMGRPLNGGGEYGDSGLSDGPQSTINPDWALTKTKTANLYSQVPQIQGTHDNKQYAAAVAPFVKSLNYEIGEKRSNVGVGMEEVLNDVVNAAGIGAIEVSYMARTENVPIPLVDLSQYPPDVKDLLIKSGRIPMANVDRVVDYRKNL